MTLLHIFSVGQNALLVQWIRVSKTRARNSTGFGVTLTTSTITIIITTTITTTIIITTTTIIVVIIDISIITVVT